MRRAVSLSGVAGSADRWQTERSLAELEHRSLNGQIEFLPDRTIRDEVKSETTALPHSKREHTRRR
jgi:hypothetical protein